MPPASYTFKGLNRTLGKALHGYQMISGGDRIAVGLSGGKDSLTLLWMLNERRRRVPRRIRSARHLHRPRIEGGFGESLQAYCRTLGFTLHVEYTDHGPVSHSSQNRENPCFLCARLRRKRLFEIADTLGCT